MDILMMQTSLLALMYDASKHDRARVQVATLKGLMRFSEYLNQARESGDANQMREALEQAKLVFSRSSNPENPKPAIHEISSFNAPSKELSIAEVIDWTMRL